MKFFPASLVKVELALWVCMLPFVGLADNDAFTNAIVLKGNGGSVGGVVDNATIEFGEPAHRGGVSCKSLWWTWQLPYNANLNLFRTGGSATNVMLAVYEGDSVEALTLVDKQIDIVNLYSAAGGTTYRIAVVVDEATSGDFAFYINAAAEAYGPSIEVPGNCLCEPSFEDTALGFTCWQVSGLAGGYVGERYGGADGTTWPILEDQGQIWQDFPTVSGHRYKVKFAFHPDFGAQSGGVFVRWDSNIIGTATSPIEDGIYWHWTEMTTIASNTTSRLTVSVDNRIALDGFSVVDVSAPPVIVTQPASVSTVAGGTASVFVGVQGTPPFRFRWYHDSMLVPDQTNFVVTLNAAVPALAGSYYVIVSNDFGSVTSLVASVSVDAPTQATILLQPYGEVIPVGGYFNLSVVAAGLPPLSYQWFKDGQVINDATNQNWVLAPAQLNDTGAYQVRVQNPAATVWSLEARVEVVTNAIGGGLIDFRNELTLGISNTVPVFDVDGITKLSGTNYVAQLYSGTSLDSLRPAGLPTPFRTGFFGAGKFVPELVTLPNVGPGSNGLFQVRVWDSSQASTYEEARATGRKFGKSEVLVQPAGNGVGPAPQLTGLQSFSLQPGLPFFTVGSLNLVEREPEGGIVWELHGSSGFRYLVQRSFEGSVWYPFKVVTNVSGTVRFTDSPGTNALSFYRARILD